MVNRGSVVRAEPFRSTGPAIYAVDPWLSGNPGKGMRHQLLSENERAQLAKVASILRLKKGEPIYREGSPAEAVYNVVVGLVSTYMTFGNRGQQTMAFLFPGDIFGLSEEGRYTISARAITAVTAYKLPVQAVRRLLATNTDLDLDIIVKLCQELRQAQRHAFILAKKSPITKLAMFLEMLEHLQVGRGEDNSEIYLPMSKTDIAEYVGVSLAAMSRAFRTLNERGVISCRDRHHAKIFDKVTLEHLADQPT
jgi:CRP/FNR family transcriptional regulator